MRDDWIVNGELILVMLWHFSDVVSWWWLIVFGWCQIQKRYNFEWCDGQIRRVFHLQIQWLIDNESILNRSLKIHSWVFTTRKHIRSQRAQTLGWTAHRYNKNFEMFICFWNHFLYIYRRNSLLRKLNWFDKSFF